jgi:hypothetical protein
MKTKPSKIIRALRQGFIRRAHFGSFESVQAGSCASPIQSALTGLGRCQAAGRRNVVLIHFFFAIQSTAWLVRQHRGRKPTATLLPFVAAICGHRIGCSQNNLRAGCDAPKKLFRNIRTLSLGRKFNPFFLGRIAGFKSQLADLFRQVRMNTRAARKGSQHDIVSAVECGANSFDEFQFSCHVFFRFISGFIAFDGFMIPKTGIIVNNYFKLFSP